jgi:LCP family protein required for cell wall assembly
MNDAQGAQIKKVLGGLFLAGLILFSFGMQGCHTEQPHQQPLHSPSQNTGTPFSPWETTPSPTLSDRSVTESTDAYQPIWGSFLPPSMDPVTPIPPPLTGLELPEEVLVWVLLGSDTEPPFSGRTMAIHLVLIHPRFSKASLVSIPGDLYVYIPGYTMQRLSTAYALGGMETLRQTLAYNFGVLPSRFVLAHPGDFQWLVDDLNQIEVTVFFPMPQACGGIPAGRITMDGALALCYVSHRDDMDEIDRMRRQQQLLRLLFLKLASDGNLAHLPVLFNSYEGWVKTDFSLPELMGYIPLALRLADPDRISYFMIGWDQFEIWEIPGHTQAKVFLPDDEAVRTVIQQAIDAVSTPSPMTNQVQTREAQLTAANNPTPSVTPSPSMTVTITPTGTLTQTEITGTGSPGLTATATPTPPGYP